MEKSGKIYESLEDTHATEKESSAGSDMEKQVRSIYGKITEMDEAGKSADTMPIKKFIESSLDKSGRLRATRLGYLEKTVNKTYIAHILAEEEKTAERDRAETDPERRKHFEIPFKGTGYQGMNFLEFDRVDERTWKTSEAGIGYTTTASGYPDWLTFSDERDREIVNDEVTGEIYYTEWKFTASIQNLPVTVRQVLRRHENGECGIIYD